MDINNKCCQCWASYVFEYAECVCPRPHLYKQIYRHTTKNKFLELPRWRPQKIQRNAQTEPTLFLRFVWPSQKERAPEVCNSHLSKHKNPNLARYGPKATDPHSVNRWCFITHDSDTIFCCWSPKPTKQICASKHVCKYASWWPTKKWLSWQELIRKLNNFCLAMPSTGTKYTDSRTCLNLISLDRYSPTADPKIASLAGAGWKTFIFMLNIRYLVSDLAGIIKKTCRSPWHVDPCAGSIDIRAKWAILLTWIGWLAGSISSKQKPTNY